MRHPEVASYTDIGQILFGRIGREVFGAAFVIVGIFVMGSHLLTWTIALNTLSNHGTCTIVFGVVGIVVFALLTVPRTLKKVSFLAIICEYSIALSPGQGWKESSFYEHYVRHTYHHDRPRHLTSGVIRRHVGHLASLAPGRLQQHVQRRVRVCRAPGVGKLHLGATRPPGVPKGPPSSASVHDRCVYCRLHRRGPLRWRGRSKSGAEQHQQDGGQGRVGGCSSYCKLMLAVVQLI